MEEYQQITYVDQEQLSLLLHSFYMLTHIKITLFDAHHNEIMTYPQKTCEICRLIRNDGIDECIRSDNDGFDKCRSTGEYLAYTCHAGLMEVICPLINDNITIGYMMFGQMICKENSEQARDNIIEKCVGLPIDKIQLKNAVNQITEKSAEEIKAAAIMMQTSIYYLISNRFVRMEKGKYVEMLDSYIIDHIADKITIETICRYFGMSRTTLYTLAQQYLECGILDYIRKKRIKYAQNLLANTQLPVTVISDKAGFSDYSYFRRVFKQETGTSCKSYRNSTFD